MHTKWPIIHVELYFRLMTTRSSVSGLVCARSTVRANPARWWAAAVSWSRQVSPLTLPVPVKCSCIALCHAADVKSWLYDSQGTSPFICLWWLGSLRMATCSTRNCDFVIHLKIFYAPCVCVYIWLMSCRIFLIVYEFWRKFELFSYKNTKA